MADTKYTVEDSGTGWVVAKGKHGFRFVGGFDAQTACDAMNLLVEDGRNAAAHAAFVANARANGLIERVLNKLGMHFYADITLEVNEAAIMQAIEKLQARPEP